MFEKYGDVEKCQIMRDPHTKESRGFGFVKMVTSEQAEAAREGLQGENVDGRTLSIEKARRARPRTPTPGKYFGPPKRGECWRIRASTTIAHADSIVQTPAHALMIAAVVDMEAVAVAVAVVKTRTATAVTNGARMIGAMIDGMKIAATIEITAMTDDLMIEDTAETTSAAMTAVNAMTTHANDTVDAMIESEAALEAALETALETVPAATSVTVMTAHPTAIRRDLETQHPQVLVMASQPQGLRRVSHMGARRTTKCSVSMDSLMTLGPDRLTARSNGTDNIPRRSSCVGDMTDSSWAGRVADVFASSSLCIFFLSVLSVRFFDSVASDRRGCPLGPVHYGVSCILATAREGKTNKTGKSAFHH